MGSSVKEIEGFRSRGGDHPALNPWSIKIVGIDVPATALNWQAHCSRATKIVTEEWLQGIREDGVRQAVDVYMDGKTAVCLEGRRRIKAARLIWNEQKAAGTPEEERISVGVTIRRGSQAELYKYNVGSHDRLDLTPIERAVNVATFMKYAGDDVDAAARFFGVSAPTIVNGQRLISLAPPIQEAVANYEISQANALKLSGFSHEEQVQKLDEFRNINAIVTPSDSTGDLEGIVGPEDIKRAEDAIESAKPEAKRTKPPKARGSIDGKVKKPSGKTVRKLLLMVKKNDDKKETPIVLDMLSWFLGGNVKDDYVKSVLEYLKPAPKVAKVKKEKADRKPKVAKGRARKK